jgi:hypothetical protein
MGNAVRYELVDPDCRGTTPNGLEIDMSVRGEVDEVQVMWPWCFWSGFPFADRQVWGLCVEHRF